MKVKSIIFLVGILLIMGFFQIVSSQSCLFISKEPDPGHANDLVLIDSLTIWGYEVTVFDEKNYQPFLDPNAWDFVFCSETISSGEAKDLLGAPLPIFTTENWAAKKSALAFVAESQAENIDPEPLMIIDDSGHFLTAGMALGTEFDLVSGTDVATEGVITNVIDVEFIPIAALASDPTKMVVYGVEAGVTLIDDASTVTQNRTAVVGIHANAYNHITSEGYKHIKTGIKWVLGEDTHVEKGYFSTPANYYLSQNYPNPFNPTTEITFYLEKPGFTTFKVYNTSGQEVSTLLECNLANGNHRVTFNAGDLLSGVYFYKITSNTFSQTRKMILMK